MDGPQEPPVVSVRKDVLEPAARLCAAAWVLVRHGRRLKRTRVTSSWPSSTTPLATCRMASPSLFDRRRTASSTRMRLGGRAGAPTCGL